MLQILSNQLVRWWFDGWCRRALRNHFCTVHQYGDRDWITRFDPQVPRLYVANHASFWDGIICYHLLRQHLRQEQIMCLIDSVQMLEHPFFGSVGGLAIDRSNPRRALKAIRAAAERLCGSAALVVFPQGQILPPDQRPLRIETGFLRILDHRPHTEVVPVSLRYDFWAEQRGEAMVFIAPPIKLAALSRSERATRIEMQLTAGLDQLADASARREPGTVVLRGKRSISEWKQVYRRN